jgi:hypothetical protein
MLRFSLIYRRRTTKTCSVFLPFTLVYRPNRPVTSPYRAVYRSKPIELVFQFGFWICSVLTGYRGLPTGLLKPRWSGLTLPIISAGRVTLWGHAHYCPLLPDQTVAKNMCRFYWPCFLHYSRCASDSETDLALKTRPFSPWTFSKFVCRDPDVLRKYHEQILAAGGVKSQVYWTMRLSCIRIWSNHA